MNWQILQFGLGIVFLLCAAIALYLKRNVGWVGAIRVSMLIFGYFALILVVITFIISLEESNLLFYKLTLLLSLSISVALLIYTAWKWMRFFLVFRKAGRIASDISHSSYELRWIFGLMHLGISLYSINEGGISLLDILLFFSGCIFLILAIRYTQYRQNGIVDKGSFIPWGSIDSLSWKTDYSNEMLNLHLKSSSEVIHLKLTPELKNNILNFINLKIPTQFKRLNQPNSPAEFTQPTNTLTNQLSS